MGNVDAPEDAAVPVCEAAERESLPVASNCINDACNRLLFAAVTFCPYCAQKQERDAPNLEYPQPPQFAPVESLTAEFTAPLPPVPQDPATEVLDEQLAARPLLPQPPPRETLPDTSIAPALVLQPAAEPVLR